MRQMTPIVAAAVAVIAMLAIALPLSAECPHPAQSARIGDMIRTAGC
jgi:hypothetical protein